MATDESSKSASMRRLAIREGDRERSGEACLEVWSCDVWRCDEKGGEGGVRGGVRRVS